MVREKTISIIVAMTPSGVIGQKGDMPWNLPSDLKRFYELTAGHPVIMGRKTFESIFRKLGSPLRGRINIILTKDKNYNADGCVVASSIDEAIEQASEVNVWDEIFVVGGSDIYELALKYTTKMYITYVDADCKGDSFFPQFDMKDWIFEVRKNWSKKRGDDFRTKFTVHKRKSTNNDYVNLAHARTITQAEVMKKIEKDGVCPFCYENILKYHTGPILKETEWWTVIENFTPYDGAAVQIVIIYKPHAVMFSEIKPGAASELPKIIRWAEKKYRIAGGTFFCRFGETELTGSSVTHLHMQLIVGNSSRNKNRSVALRVKLGYYTKNDS